MLRTVALVTIALVLFSQAMPLRVATTTKPTTVAPSYPDSDYYAMQERINAALDMVSGHDFIYQWFPLLDDVVTVCYPFVGRIDADHCLVGIDNVRKSWSVGPFMSENAQVNNRFWLSKDGAATMGVFEYTTSGAYLLNNTTQACVVQFNGFVMWRLSPTNSSLLDLWLETPNSNRISETYPCTL